MKALIIIIGLFFSTISTYGQSISGIITDQNGDPAAYSEILLISDQGAVESAVTDPKGSFNITIDKTDNYTMHVYHLGLEVFLEQLMIEDDIVKNISINKNVELEEVTITAKKKLVQRKVDRLVYNVANSIAATGMDATEALSLTPMLKIDDMGIAIVGKSGVAVMINDKMINLSGADLINYLKSLRSDDIEKIEVITAPPAKYEAEGNSGLINIILKRNTKLGWSGNFASSFSKTSYASYGSNLTTNFQSGKVNLSIRLRHYDRSIKATEKINVIGKNSILSNDTRKDNYKGLGANVSLDYKMNDRSSVGFIYDLGRQSTTMDIHNKSQYLSNNIINEDLETQADHRSTISVQTLNVYHDLKFDDKGKKLSLGANYFSNLPETVVDFSTISNIESTQNATVRNQTDIDYNIWSLQADLIFPTSFGKLETGTKYASSSNNSNVAYFNKYDDTFQIDPSRSNLFEYSESNIASYISLDKSFNSFWSAKAGMRYEYTNVEGFSPDTKEKNNFNYGKWFPTLYLSYRPNDLHSFSWNYSKRINRPSFRSLNPFRWYSNPLSYFTGNPLLQPSYNHNLEVSYAYKGILSLNIYSQKVSNGFGRFVKVENQFEKIINYENYLTEYKLGMNASLYLNPTSWWETYVDANLSYSDSRSTIPSVLAQKGSSFYYSINNSLTFSKEKGLHLMINFWHQLPNTVGNVYLDHLNSLSIGVRCASLLDSKLNISIMASDVFKGSESNGELYYSDFIQTFQNYYNNQRLTINMSYRFGNDKVKGSNKRVKFEEKARV